jgi:hypothetical protein
MGKRDLLARSYDARTEPCDVATSALSHAVKDGGLVGRAIPIDLKTWLVGPYRGSFWRDVGVAGVSQCLAARGAGPSRADASFSDVLAAPVPKRKRLWRYLEKVSRLGVEKQTMCGLPCLVCVSFISLLPGR